MLTRGETQVTRDARREAQAKYDARLASWCEAELATSGLIGAENDPTNVERQLGVGLWPGELEAVLQTLDPGLQVERNPRNPTKGVVTWTRRGDSGVEKETLFPCEWGLMPEYSIMSRRTVEVPFLGHHADPGTPMFVDVEAVGEEVTRGWRSVLARLVQRRVLTPTQVENAFGVSPRKAWATLLGRRREALPF